MSVYTACCCVVMLSYVYRNHIRRSKFAE